MRPGGPKMKFHRRKMRPGGPETLDSRNIFKIKAGGRARGALNLKQSRVSGPGAKVASQCTPVLQQLAGLFCCRQSGKSSQAGV